MRFVLRRQAARLEVYDGDYQVATFVVGVGKPDSPTPVGHWQLLKSRPDDDPDRIAVLTTSRLICLRETRDLESLGTPASGG
ncbi:L,D-transpeptidase [Sulfobacillus harzensis]|uniref:L,D-transpeptidase n=1 Tax=Sulfobacillus harzensis TaxID=2729629 RepID=A0A7Y0Q3V8_9FIRM|nr:L,D-transpeptidase [Sulfobacillus harzensis]NMP23957.1 L,D-transpeptidase [Sulfobacillus harzensis]